MKPKTWLAGVLALGFVSVVGGFALTSPEATTTNTTVDRQKLSQALALFDQGQLQEANTLLTHIHKNNNQYVNHPDYVIALCYEALCKHGLKDWRGYLSVVGSSSIQKAKLPDDLRAELNLKAMDALNGITNRQDFLRALEAPWLPAAVVPAAAREGWI